jgi:copper chaperone CopZ
MKRFFVVAVVMMFVMTPGYAFSDTAMQVGEPAEVSSSNESDHAPVPEIQANHLVIDVNGVVCSFCAYGLTKALGKLSSVDTSMYGNGVRVEIESQRVTLALLAERAIDFADIFERIKDAGYDPVRFYFNLTGTAAQTDGKWVVTGTNPRQRFTISNGSASVQQGKFMSTVYLDASVAKVAVGSAPIEVVVHGHE